MYSRLWRNDSQGGWQVLALAVIDVASCGNVRKIDQRRLFHAQKLFSVDNLDNRIWGGGRNQPNRVRLLSLREGTWSKISSCSTVCPEKAGLTSVGFGVARKGDS